MTEQAPLIGGQPVVPIDIPEVSMSRGGIKIPAEHTAPAPRRGPVPEQVPPHPDMPAGVWVVHWSTGYYSEDARVIGVFDNEESADLLVLKKKLEDEFCNCYADHQQVAQ